MSSIRLIFSEITAFFSFSNIQNLSQKTFQLKKHRIQAPKLLVALIAIVLFGSTFIYKLTSMTSNPIAIGDSILTSSLIEKEKDYFAPKTINSKEDLKKNSDTPDVGFAFYRVLPGENLSSVADKFGLTMATVLSLNSLNNVHSIDVGEKVLLSTRSGIIFNTTNKESVADIAERYGINEQDIVDANSLEHLTLNEGTTLFLPEANYSFDAMAKILGIQFINPVPRYRRISSHFGWRRHPILGRRILHKGIDFAAPTGTPTLAAKEGRVIYAGWNGSFGLHIVIRHNNGWTTSYSHLSKIFVKKGQWVSTAQRIGSIGSTGRSTGPHLHLELKKYGRAVNPIYNGLQITR